MKKLVLIIMLAIIATTLNSDIETDEAFAVLCFYSYEQVSGMNKICIYDCAGSTTAITIKNYELCPVTIEN